MQNTLGICVQICLGSLNTLMLNTVKGVLLWQKKLKKNALTVDTQNKNLRFITVTLLMLKSSKNQCKKLLSLKHSVRAT